MGDKMDTKSMVFSEMIRTEIMDVIKGMGDNLEAASKNLVMEAIRGGVPSGISAYDAIGDSTCSIVNYSVEFAGDVCGAAKGAVEGAVEGAREGGLDAERAASVAATAAVTAGYEISPAVGTKIKKAVAGTSAGVKVVIVKPASLFKRPVPKPNAVSLRFNVN